MFSHRKSGKSGTMGGSILYASFTDVPPRFDGTLRLFRMILDVNHPAFQIEDRQWRPSVIEIFIHYFACIWKDPTVSLLKVTLLS